MKKCDLVMKGGITSGVVYPAAVCELAREYRFMRIGGTSAGAIAAALTAAAEYRRQGGSDAGFRELEALPEWMAGGDGLRLLALFQPHRDGETLFRAALAFLTTRGGAAGKSFGALRVLAARLSRFGAAAAVPGLLLVAGAIVAFAAIEGSASRAITIIAGLVALLLTVAAYGCGAVAEAFVSAWRVLPSRGYGLCSGGGEGAVTAWLDRKLRDIAGVSHPLTFGDLASHGVDLQMMTTNLTHGRPYRFPAETRRFFFSPTEWRGLFPSDVVDAMIAAAARRPQQRTNGGEVLYPLPEGAQLPVIVAARMSLSFPLLMAAVPLWSNDFARRDAEPEAERCWFSDGGITSNFPVHFFDRPLPRWPTFAFNLADWTRRYHAPGQNVYAPRSNMGGLLEWWTPIDGVGDFLAALKNTMQNWRDNMLLHLPGQRDRISHVLLLDDEGGLNLTMDAPTILRLAAKGKEAAADLRVRFGDSPPRGVRLTWRNHQWVRLRSYMAAEEEALENCVAAWEDAESSRSYEAMLAGELAQPSYRVNAAERERMYATARSFFEHVRDDFAGNPFRAPRRRPRVQPVLRAMPRE